MGIEPIYDGKVCLFNRHIKNWLTTNDKKLETAVCNLLKQTEIHLMFGVIYSDVVPLLNNKKLLGLGSTGKRELQFCSRAVLIC